MTAPPGRPSKRKITERKDERQTDFSKNANMAETAPAFLRLGHAFLLRRATSFRASISTSTRARSALLGRNGAGKTTTLRSIAHGLAAGAEGRDLADHQPLHKMTSYEAAGAASACARGSLHHSWPHGRGEPAACPDRAAGGLVDRAIYELFPRLENAAGGRHLSGGEQQMLSIAALARDIKVLLLTNPTKVLPWIVDETKDPAPREGAGHDHDHRRTERRAGAATADRAIIPTPIHRLRRNRRGSA
ncbi:ATP-binding cassette domain-containing protein [Antarctobacter sp.]|uniref:ATP-binding cassette domain-containing protein n=1 Tax=Antarctobacter sp. TaxID=1872577 RepID=UPI003A8FA544